MPKSLTLRRDLAFVMRSRQRPRTTLATLALAFAMTFVSGCKSKECVPGQQVACACPGGAQGVQACDVDGSRYLPCICTAPQTQVAAPAQTPPPRRKKQIRCGPLTCDIACCATFEPPSCSRDPKECARTEEGDAVIYECDGPEDCSVGQACCLVPGKTVIAAVCVPRQECTGSYPHSRHGTTVAAKKVCHANIDCDVSGICAPSGDSTGILTCNK
jgi:hypothetical protein